MNAGMGSRRKHGRKVERYQNRRELKTAARRQRKGDKQRFRKEAE